jgi:hypothetical protein
MRKVKLRDRKNVRLRNRRRYPAPERRRTAEENMRLVTPSRLDQRAAAIDSSFETWIKDNPPPDLGELVKAWGTFSQIPPHAWSAWDAQLRDWQARVRTRQWDTARTKQPAK